MGKFYANNATKSASRYGSLHLRQMFVSLELASPRMDDGRTCTLLVTDFGKGARKGEIGFRGYCEALCAKICMQSGGSTYTTAAKRGKGVVKSY